MPSTISLKWRPRWAEILTLRQSPLSHRQAHAERLVHSPVPYNGYRLMHHGNLVACGQYAREGRLVGLYDVYTDPAHRGKGYATALCEQLLISAAREGAQHAYLQVDASNAVAISIYRELGFVEGYRYHYRADESI